MKRIIGIIFFTLLVVALVGSVVFLKSTLPPKGASQNVSNSNVTVDVSKNITRNITNSTIQSTKVTGSAVNLSNSVSQKELSQHNSQEDCWVGFEGEVYDITNFLPKHPGSAAAIIPYCGSSKEFEEAFIAQHGRTKVSFLMKVGKLIGDFEVKGGLS